MPSKLTEFYLELQGRPDSKIVLDMESRKPVVPFGYVDAKVNKILETIMKDELASMVELLTRLLVEIEQMKLHLASMSDANIDERSVRK